MRSSPPGGTTETSQRAFLVVSRGVTSEVVDLLPGAEFTAGRGAGCDLSIDDAGLPETALHLSWDGESFRARAARGAVLHWNGKPFGGDTLLDSGDELALGRTRITVGVAAPAVLGPRRALPHDAFVARLTEELARAARVHRPTALVMLRVGQRAGEINELAAETFRAGDLISSFSPNEPEFLLADTDAETAAVVVRRLLERAGEHAYAGIADSIEAGETPERLLWSARRALHEAVERDVALVFGTRAGRELEDVWIAEDPVFRTIEEKLDALSRRGESVLFYGEPNVGKCTAARRLMAKSGVVPELAASFSCGALGDGASLDLAFGTEDAPGGTLLAARSPLVLLEDVHELRPRAQRRLLAAMDAAGRFKRYLSTSPRSLLELVDRGTFDPALAARLAEVEVELPPLRVRAADVLPLALRFAEMSGARRPRLSAGAIARLRSYAWPGNVLELRNAMERAVLLARGGEILGEHLPADPLSEDHGRLREHVGGVERDTIIRALADANYNQTHAARRLGISRRALIYKMEKYGLKPPPGYARR